MALLRLSWTWRMETNRQREVRGVRWLSGIVALGIVVACCTVADAKHGPELSEEGSGSDQSVTTTSNDFNLPRRFRGMTKNSKKDVLKSNRLTPQELSRFPNAARKKSTAPLSEGGLDDFEIRRDQVEKTNGSKRIEKPFQFEGPGIRQSNRLLHISPPGVRQSNPQPPLPEKSSTLRRAGRIAPLIAGRGPLFEGDTISKVVRQVTHEAESRFTDAIGRTRVIDFQIPEDPFQDEPIEEFEADDSADDDDVAMFEEQGAPAEMNGAPFEVIDPDPDPITVTVRRSVLMRTDYDIYRTAVVDPDICDLVQFTPREVSIIGREVGSTTVTFWFKTGYQPLTYVVNVEPDLEARRVLEDEYEVLARILTELFPDSKVELLPVADKLIVRGQAKDAQEAAQILQIIRSEAGIGNRREGPSGSELGSEDPTVGGLAAAVLSPNELGGRSRSGLTLVNLLRVPGPQQIALKVKIAELNRSVARGYGVDVDAEINVTDTAGLFINSMLNAASGTNTTGPAVISQFDGDDIQIGVRWLEQEGVLRMLSEPTLVTLSGRPATFVAGGEFAVPTAVGVGGIGAITTDFRTFGAIISFLPTVIDKDYIRLEVSPEFSQINSGLSNNTSFGLDVRSVTTTVEMREGQTLAIAGLIDDSVNGTKRGNLPVFSHIFGRRDISHNETELIILVTPELIHPLDPEEVPPLPGFDVMEANNHEFFLHGHLEGSPTQNHRSTTWPRLRRRYRGNGTAVTSGAFGHGQ